MDHRRLLPPWVLPAVCAAIVTAVVGVMIANVSWPFVDLYRLFRDAAASSWSETFASAFGSGVEYRPLLTIGVKLSHQLVGLRAWFYKALVVMQFAAILAGLIWIFAPRTHARAVAACLAIACAVGLHSSMVLFMFVPLNAYSLGLLLLIAAIIVGLSPRSQITEWVFLSLTLVALFVLESGSLLVAVTLVLWRMKAPGVTGRAVVATLVAAVIYGSVRLAFSGAGATATYAETGLGFSDVSASRLSEIFGNAPWLLWLYNVVASALTVLASEPRGGRYMFIEAMLNGRVPLWMHVHVVTSLATTALVFYALRKLPITDRRDCLIVGAGLTLMVCGSALGFLYTRDRIALFAGIGYAMLVYVAAARLLQPVGASVRPAILATVVLALVGAGWVTRVGETVFALRDAGWENHQEWTTRYAELGGLSRPQTDMLLELRRQVLAHPPNDPRRDPAWSYVLFQRTNDRMPAD